MNYAVLITYLIILKTNEREECQVFSQYLSFDFLGCLCRKRITENKQPSGSFLIGLLQCNHQIFDRIQKIDFRTESLLGGKSFLGSI